jgi:hypothetical protein
MNARTKNVIVWSVIVLIVGSTIAVAFMLVRNIEHPQPGEAPAPETWTPIGRCDASMTQEVLNTLKASGIRACSPFGSRGDALWVATPQAGPAQELLRRKALKGVHLFDPPLPPPQSLQ